MGRSRLARLGYAVVAGILAAGVLSAPAAAAAGGTIQGSFTNVGNGPIAGATVVAYSADQDWLADTVTDADGHFRLTGVTAGGVRLQFDDQGRQQWSPGVRESDDATLYDLAAGGTLTVDERQPATGKVAGHLTDASGAPVPAQVTVEGVDHWAYLFASTDEQGAWSVDALPGTYKVYFQWDSVRQDVTAPVTVTAGHTSELDESKLPTGTADGRLTTASGAPLVSADVTLHRDDTWLNTVRTDDDGRYSLGEVLAGDGYTVSFSVDGAGTQWVPGTVDRAKARTFTIAAGEHTTIDDTQLSPARMQGRLVDSDGKPQARFRVTATLSAGDDSVSYDAVTDDDGRWSVTGLNPGRYYVSFSTPDRGRTQWAYGKGSSEEAMPIDVATGASVTVDDTWLPGATLVVNAVDAVTGAPVKNFCVSVDQGDGCTTGSQVTVRDQPGGAAHVSVRPGQAGYYLPHNDVPVTLVAGGTTTVTVPVTQGGKVAVTATDHATGAAVRDACGVFLVLGRGGLPDGYGDCTDRTGKLTTIAMAAGTYELFAVAPNGYGHQWVGRTGGTGDQRAAARIKVTPGSTVQAPAVLLDPPGTITGVVSDAAGKPLAGADVAYSAWGDAGPGWNTKTNADGVYTIDELGPYGWPLLFSSSGYPRQWSGNGGNRFTAEAVPAGTYDIALRTTSTLEGKVSVPNAPGAGWRIHVVNAATGDQMGVFDSTAAGAGGAYSMPLAGGQQVRIAWSYHTGEGNSVTGWYHHAAKVGIPAAGTRKVNLILG